MMASGRPALRRSGPLPGPDTRVVELRVAGARGTTPEGVVDAVAAVDIAGDGVGRIVRPADRLRRPAPGPVLKADGRPQPRVVEGYLWGRCRAGAVAWAPLFPFALANLAAWMLPPVPADRGAAAWPGICCQALVRLACVLLTVLLVAQVTALSLGLWPGWGTLPPLVGLAALSLGRMRRVARWPPVAGPLAGLPGVGRTVEPAGLRTVHVAAGLATVAVLGLDGAFRWWVAALAVLACCVGLAVGFGGRVAGFGGAPVPRRVLLVAAFAVAGAGPALRPDGGVPVTDLVTWAAVAVGGTCVLFALVLVPAVLAARPAWAGSPVELRPWAGGWAAAPVLAAAALLGGGFGAVVGVAAHQLGRVAVPAWYADLLWAWGVAGVLAGVLAGALATVAVLARSRVPELLPWRTRGHQVLFGVVGAVVVAGVGGWWLADRVAWPADVGLGVVVVLGGWLVWDVRVASWRPEWMRWLGPLVELAWFWPATAHPFGPPCAAAKAVPEVAARAAEHLAEPTTRVVLSGHGQGSVLVLAAAARLVAELPADAVDRLGIVLAGSPVGWAYSRAFPGVVPRAGLAELFGELGGRWRTLARDTDRVGGGVTTWRRQVFDDQVIGVGYRPDGTVGALAPAATGPTGALVLGGDHWLPDPADGPFPGRRWAPGVLRHRDYYADPEWDRAVACAAGLESPTRVRTEQTVLLLPGRTAVG